jgi:hypothetical protein
MVAATVAQHRQATFHFGDSTGSGVTGAAPAGAWRLGSQRN